MGSYAGVPGVYLYDGGAWKFRYDDSGVRFLDYEPSRHTAQLWQQPSCLLCLKDCRATSVARATTVFAI